MAKKTSSPKQTTLDNHILNSIVQPLRHTPQQPLEKKPRQPRRKLSVIRERCECLIRMQWPERVVTYEKLRLDMLTKLNLADRITLLKYLGRASATRSSKMMQLVRYMKTGTTVPKEHVFTTKTDRKKGYLEIYGYAQMETENGKNNFRIFYENLTDKQTVLQEKPPNATKGEGPKETTEKVGP